MTNRAADLLFLITSAPSTNPLLRRVAVKTKDFNLVFLVAPSQSDKMCLA